jgi:hypothetical protein
MHGGDENAYKILTGNPENLDVGGSILLKWALRKQAVGVWFSRTFCCIE